MSYGLKAKSIANASELLRYEGNNRISYGGKLLKTWVNPSGYVLVHVPNGTDVFVHQIVAFLKYGNKSVGEEIHTRHLNGNKKDNDWDNIAIGTARDNRMDLDPEVRSRGVSLAKKRSWEKMTPERRSEIGIKINLAGGNTILSNDEIYTIRSLYSEGNTTTLKLAKRFNCCSSTIGKIVFKRGRFSKI